MNEAKQDYLNDLIDHGYDFHFGRYITEGYELFKRQTGNFIAFMFITILISFSFDFIPYISEVVNTIIQPVLTVGFYIVAHQLHKNESADFSDFFKGFSHFVPLVLASLFYSFIFIVPFYESSYWPFNLGDFLNFSLSLWQYLLFIPIIYFAVAWSWASLFIIFYDLRFWDAMEMSRQLITKKWLELFLFFIVLLVIGLSGAIFCGIGIFYTMPIAYTIHYIAFADVIKLLDEHERGLESHLID